ncbi:MAG TPA: CHAT domain-containing tetratricopeptide repeat protein [Blastocatellia bacterium]|nr:CHAT domain-containing tetratricopeptide repeat protein [Blastocatellia bacterium]
MSRELADKLIKAESAQSFLREQGVVSGWQTISSLKSEVDRLIGVDLNAAQVLADRVEQLAALSGDSISKAFSEVSRARVLHHLGRYEEAERLYSSAVSALRAAHLTAEAAVIQVQQVALLRQMGSYTEALRVGRAARRSLLRGEPAQLAQLETNVGNVYYRLDRYKKALSHYERAREILASAGDETMRAVVDTNRSHVLMEMDRPGEALTLLENAARAMQDNGQKLWAAQTQFHIAYLQFLRGNYNAALTTHYQAREQLIELGSTQLVAWCNHEIAEILLALNAFDDAAESAATARSSFAELGMPYEAAQATFVRALAAMGQQQFEQARSDLEEARQVFTQNNNRPLTALIDTYLAELAIRRNDPAEAARFAASALRVFAQQKLSTRLAYTRLLAARAAYEMGDLTKALRMARTALSSVEGLYAPVVAYQCHHLLGRVERDRKRGSHGLDNFRRAVGVIEKMRGGIAADEFKATFLRDKINAYEDTIAACLDAGTDELTAEAFELVESSKSRALADLLARYVRAAAPDDSESSRAGLKPETRERMSKLIEDLSWYSSQAGLAEDKGDQRSAEVADRYRHAVAQCERQIAQLFRRIEIEAPAFAEIQRMRAASISDLRETLDPGETVIEFFTTGDHVSAFIASRESFRVARRVALKGEVERLLATLRFQIEKFNYGSDYIEAYFGQLRRGANETLNQLYKSLFAPLEAMISGDRLIIIPHGALHYVPFHALADGGGYLIERFEISYAPSASVLKLCRARRNGSRISNLKSEVSEMVALGLEEIGTPSIGEEIDALAQLFPGAVMLRGESATRSNLLRVAPRARYLHLASHGYFRRDNPMFSFLKLADSQLNFYSLLDLKLNAEMVTLSACHTGVNKVFPGDELHGLMRGFLYAGAPSVIASLWAVSDRSTADFMREMYSRIRAGATKRAALRAAQIAIKDAYGHPYYWAPFVLMGNPE